MPEQLARAPLDVGPTSSAGPPIRAWDAWLARTFVIAAAVASLLLAATLLVVYRAVAEASVLLVQGEGARFAEAVHQALRTGPRPPRQATLDAVLAEERVRGLRYVAVLGPDGRGVQVAAGETSTPIDAKTLAALQGMMPVAVGDRVRILSGPPLGGPAAPPHRAPAPEPPDGRRGPPPPPGHAPPPRLVLEFEPVAARRLLALARRTAWIGVVAVPAFACSALFLGYLVRQRDRLVRRLEHGRRLAALGEMSAVIAHEVRNPLASLKGHAQLLARALGDDPRRAKAELVVREAVRLEALATDLLDFASLRSVERRVADPAAVLRESAEAVDPERIELRLEQAPASWPLDPERMRQALVNVLRNAVQASPADEPVEAAVFAAGDELVFEVRDHGQGIPPGDEERIFEPFYTRKVRGSGLGLAIARRIAAQQGGTVAATNAPAGGAVFRVSISRT
jgi:two-component system sensor histidine kinase HydH